MRPSQAVIPLLWFGELVTILAPSSSPYMFVDEPGPVALAQKGRHPMIRNSARRAKLLFTVAGMVPMLAGCFGEFAESEQPDKSESGLAAKQDDSWIPPGLEGTGKSPGPWNNPPDNSSTASMMFEMEGFDLETATVYQEEQLGYFSPEVDFYFAYNADTANHIRLFQLYPGSIASSEATLFADVDCLGESLLTQDLIDVPFDPENSVVLKTADGNYYKIGRAVENDDNTVTFSFEELNCAP